MKIGILTFHSQLNYGGVLQCWALQMALERMGHDVVVLDRRLYPEPAMFGGIVPRVSAIGWAKLFLRGLLLGGGFAWLKRCAATKRFVRSKLHLTTYHFHAWPDAPRELGVDMIIVGSDQVWHCGDWGDPSVYLLHGAPNVDAVAYAASFGVSQLPEYIYATCDGDNYEMSTSFFSRHLRRFRAISCRETDGVEICHRIGVSAVHVVDPTLLAWYKDGYSSAKLDRLVCYFLSENIEESWPDLEQFAQKQHANVEVFNNATFLATPISLCGLKNIIIRVFRRLFSRVRLRLDKGPDYFLKSFEGAKWVVTDSYHALMFSIINGCNVRIVRPSNAMRKTMFSRMSEFVAHADGPLVVGSIKEAMHSFEKGERCTFDKKWVSDRVDESRIWLRQMITGNSPRQG